MILQYIGLVCSQPDAFEFLESQERDFNRWKQDILQNVSRLLEQTRTALRIIKRRGLKEDEIKKYEEQYILSNETLDKIFKILFFVESEKQGEGDEKLLRRQQEMFLDQ